MWLIICQEELCNIVWPADVVNRNRPNDTLVERAYQSQLSLMDWSYIVIEFCAWHLGIRAQLGEVSS